MLQIIRGKVLLPHGRIEQETVTIEDGCIGRIGASISNRGKCLDARGLLLLPGIVDLHGDGFERQLMPRPGVFFPHPLALRETDRQMASNGITTAYHGLTYSWEPGLRGAELARTFLENFETERPQLACDTRLHLRFETHNLAAAEEISGWIRDRRIHLLAFNDHMECYRKELDIPRYVTVFESRTGLSKEAYAALLEEVQAVKPMVGAAVDGLAHLAKSCGIPMASHDDGTVEARHRYHFLGCNICEFPTTRDTASAARKLGNAVVLGAPNVVRGGSQTSSRVSARESIEAGLCSVLTSDYYYPAPLLAPFQLEAEGVLPLEDAWALVSRNPADAVALTDRGEIAPGKRADLVLVDPTGPGSPKAVAVWVGGRLVYLSELGMGI